MRCVACGSSAVSERRERTVQGYRRFRCRACGKQFNERSEGLLNRTQYPSDIIALVVLWRLRYKLSLRDLTEMFLIRGIVFSYEAVRDWEAKLAPALVMPTTGMGTICRAPNSAVSNRTRRIAASWPGKFVAKASSTACPAIASSASVDTMPTPNCAVTPVTTVPCAAQRVASATTRSVTACVVLPFTSSNFIVRCPPSA